MKNLYLMFDGGSTYILSSVKNERFELVDEIYDVIIKDYYNACIESDFKARTENGVKIESVLKELAAERASSVLGYDIDKHEIIVE